MRITIEQGLPGAEAAAARDDATVIIDVIRASTTYATALSGGAERIVPCASRAHLDEVRQRYPEALQSGERECRRIDGYDLGSSPAEMAGADLSGKTLLSSTTNGSRMVVAASSAPVVVMAGFCNSSAVARFLRERGDDVSLVCSGRLGEPVIEDWIGATWLAHLLDNNGDFELSKDEIRERCRGSPSYDALLTAGRERDFDLCLAFDSLDVVPLLDGDGFITATD